jgi:hypothetical protein
VERANPNSFIKQTVLAIVLAALVSAIILYDCRIFAQSTQPNKTVPGQRGLGGLPSAATLGRAGAPTTRAATRGSVAVPSAPSLYEGRPNTSTTRPVVAPTIAVRTLVNQLDDPARREAASSSLTQMGAAIVPQLYGALKEDVSPEAAAQIRAIVAILDPTSPTVASAITMHYRDAPLKDVLLDFAHQLGANISLDSRAGLPVTRGQFSIDIDRGTCWDVIRQLQARTPLRPTKITDNQIVFSAGTSQSIINAKGPFVVVGPFLIQAESTSFGREVYFDEAQPRDNLVTKFMLYPEPKVSIAVGKITCSPMTMIDNLGQTLPIGQADMPFVELRGISYGYLLLDGRKPPENPGTHLKSLSATLSADVQTGSVVVELDDLAHSTGQTRELYDGITLRIKSVVMDPGKMGFTLEFTGPHVESSVKEPAGVAMVTRNPLANLEFFDASGHKMQPGLASAAMRSVTNTIDTAEQGIFCGSAMPARMRFRIGTSAQTVKLPFEFTDLELPTAPLP